MKRETYVSIPQPCHENWDKMTPQDKGRFCASCAKTVIDFSQMSDTQVLNYLSQSTGRLCGRFAQDQLERPLVSFKKEKKKIWWMAALMPLTLLLNKANGQWKNDKRENSDVVYSTCAKRVNINDKLLDNIALRFQNKVITGTIVDENKRPLTGVSITIKGTTTGTTTDTSGKFLLSFNNDESSVTLNISYIGYESKEVSYAITNSDVVDINTQTLSLVPLMSGDVVVVIGYGVRHRPVKKIDTLKTTVQKIFKVNPFKVYPNPAVRGSEVNIEVRKEGHYSIQLLDFNSKLIAQNPFDAVKGATKTSFPIPSSASSGMYFIRLIDDDTKQQFTDKIIIQ